MDQDPTDAEAFRRLLERHVPELASGVVQIRGLIRKAGSRSIVVVSSDAKNIDVVGAVVGTRGIRIKSIAKELGDVERIDVVRWSDSIEQFLGNLFAPNKVLHVRYDEPNRRAMVALACDVIDSSTPMRLELASSLVGWMLVLE